MQNIGLKLYIDLVRISKILENFENVSFFVRYALIINNVCYKSRANIL
jgi:hypothetical protein